MLTPHDLRELDAAVTRTAAGRARGELTVLGVGAVTCVVEWRGHACRRLPTFHGEARLDAFRDLLARYIARLQACGIDVVPTRVESLRRDDGKFNVYVVQPRIDLPLLLPVILRTAGTAAAVSHFTRLLDAVDACVTSQMGLDAQVTNWAVQDRRLVLLDVTTPLMRGDSGDDLLDPDVFVGALPAVFRPVARAWLVPGMLDRFFDPRAILIDAVANLAEAGVAHLTDPFLLEANARVPEPITTDEIAAYRRRGAFAWALMRRALLLEQAWQRGVLRTGDPALLPFDLQNEKQR